MASFPTLSSGTTSFYPVSDTLRFRTGVIKHLDFSEQRWREQAELHRIVIEWRNLSRADKNLITGWFDTNKGPFDATWEFPLGAEAWQFFVFDEETLSIREEASRPNRFTISAAFHQVRKN